MVTPVRLRTEILADPIAAWDELEAGITFLEEEINAKNPTYTVTPFVPGQRTSTWVMTKAEIQGLEDRMHAVSTFLKIPHIRTVWFGKMPVGYNAMNHFILGLAPVEWIADGFDIDGDLGNIVPIDYSLPDLDWIYHFRHNISIDDWIPSTITGSALVTLNNTDTVAEAVNKTTDGGSSWAGSTSFEKGTSWLSSWVYLGNGIIIAGFWDGTVMKSADGGAAWGTAQLLGSAAGVTALCDLGGGMVLAGVYLSAKAYRSENYGDTWTKVEGFVDYDKVNSLCYLGDGIVVACLGSYIKMLSRSTNYGLDWSTVYAASDMDYLNTPVFLGNSVVLFVGLTDVYRSVDNGANWAKVIYRAATDVTGVPIMAVIALGVAVVCIKEWDDLGNSSVSIYRTTDYGANWSGVATVDSLDDTLDISAIISIGGTNLLASGKDENGGRIYRSTDSGSTWTLVKTYTGASLSCDNLLLIGA